MRLAAGHDGDLVAFDAEEPDRVDPLALSYGRDHYYGPPAFDAVRGRIYLGANDKRLYALDARGLFLWSFDTGDIVATRPVVAGDTVVFGSEEPRAVYGLDATTGALRWTRTTGGPIVIATCPGRSVHGGRQTGGGALAPMTARRTASIP